MTKQEAWDIVLLVLMLHTFAGVVYFLWVGPGFPSEETDDHL